MPGRSAPDPGQGLAGPDNRSSVSTGPTRVARAILQPGAAPSGCRKQPETMVDQTRRIVGHTARASLQAGGSSGP